MNQNRTAAFAIAGVLIAGCSTAALAQSPRQPAGPRSMIPGPTAPAASQSQPATGPHGGTLRQTGGLQLETIVSQSGIQLFGFDLDGQPVSVEQARGAVLLRIARKAKRYRYDLLPDGVGSLTAPVNLSAIAGRQIELDIQLAGVSTARGRIVSLREVATIPASQEQLAAAAIARQKICPVTGQPLGSMGKPVAVEAGGRQVYVCCAGCTSAIKSEPAKYPGKHPKITVTAATAADTALIAQQAKCPVLGEPLGSMGKPIKMMVGDKPIFLCCEGCINKVRAEPNKYLSTDSQRGVSSPPVR